MVWNAYSWVSHLYLVYIRHSKMLMVPPGKSSTPVIPSEHVSMDEIFINFIYLPFSSQESEDQSEEDTVGQMIQVA